MNRKMEVFGLHSREVECVVWEHLVGSSHMSDEASCGVASTSVSAVSRGGDVSNGRGGHVGNDVGLLSVHGNVDGLVDWGGVGSDDGLLVVGGVGGVVHMGGLDDLLDGVHLVRGRHGHGTGNGDLVRGRDVLVHNHGALNGDGHMDGHVNVVVLDLNLRDDVGLLRGDPGVGPHRGEDLLLDNGVSRGVGVASNHAGVSGLHNLAADNSVLGVLLNHWGASGVGLVGLASDDWGRGNGGTVGNGGSMGDTNVLGGASVAGVANGGHTVVKELGCT